MDEEWRADGLDVVLLEHPHHITVGPNPDIASPRLCSSRSTSHAATNSDSARLAKAWAWIWPTLPQPTSAVRTRVHPLASIGKILAAIRRRNASDSAISSMPFIPSSMLIQPW